MPINTKPYNGPIVTCFTCKQPSNISPMGTSSGKPRRVCYACMAIQEKNSYHRYKQKRLLTNPRSVNNGRNYDSLSRLKRGIYTLHSFATGKPTEAILAVRDTSFFLDVFGKRYVIFPDLMGIAAFISNFNLLVIPDSTLRLLGKDGRELQPEDLGVGMERTDLEEIFPTWMEKLKATKLKAQQNKAKRDAAAAVEEERNDEKEVAPITGSNPK